MSVLAPSLTSYKIQLQTLWGWADLKSSEDGGDYEVEFFDSVQDAQNELNDMVDSLNDSPELYRVVSSNEKQDIDIYE